MKIGDEDQRDKERVRRKATLLTGVASSPIDVDHKKRDAASRSRPPTREICREHPGRWTSVTLVMIECHMKLEYTRPAAAGRAEQDRGISATRGYAGPAVTVGVPSSGASIRSAFVDRDLRDGRASRSRMQAATYESRTRLGNESRTAASRIPRVCVSATRQKRRRSP